jgi:hypothetical protein
MPEAAALVAGFFHDAGGSGECNTEQDKQSEDLAHERVPYLDGGLDEAIALVGRARVQIVALGFQDRGF